MASTIKKTDRHDINEILLKQMFLKSYFPEVANSTLVMLDTSLLWRTQNDMKHLNWIATSNIDNIITENPFNLFLNYISTHKLRNSTFNCIP